MNRRRFLARLSTVSALGVAGCSQSGGGGSPAETAESTPTPSPTEMESPTSTPASTSVDEESPTETSMGTPTESPTPTATPRPAVAAEVEVGPDGQFAFRPETVSISQGETVRWIWRAGGHNVKPENIPSDSEWTGTPGERSDTFSAGYVYTHTFEVTGRFDYLCVPHQSLGMKGTVIVE